MAHTNYYDSGTKNAHTNHLNANAKKYVVNIPWDSENFNTDGTVKGDIIKSDQIKDLRQHAKAIGKNYHNITPVDDAVADSEIEAGVDYIKQSNLNEGAATSESNTGLLDIMDKNNVMDLSGTDPSVVTAQSKITRDKIDSIGKKIEAASQYANYSNHYRTGSGLHRNGYVNHSNSHSNSSRSSWCHRNHNNHSNNGGTVYVNGYSYINTQSYSNSFTDPATYQNAL